MSQAGRISTTRRSILLGAVATLPNTAIPAAALPLLDADILANEPAYTDLMVRLDTVLDEVTVAETAYYKWAGRNPKPELLRYENSETVEHWTARKRAWDKRAMIAAQQSGLTSARSNEKLMNNEVDQFYRSIETKRAQTLEGLRFKARMAARRADPKTAWSIVDDLLGVSGHARA